MVRALPATPSPGPPLAERGPPFTGSARAFADRCGYLAPEHPTLSSRKAAHFGPRIGGQDAHENDANP